MPIATLLVALLAGQGEVPPHPWPERTVVMIAQDGRLFMADPGPGKAPEGEEDTSYKQSFYYHASSNAPGLSMSLVEADCAVEGKWRIRASSIYTVQPGYIQQGGQALARRALGWTQEYGESGQKPADSLGLAIWKNTCQGDLLDHKIAQFSPWTTGMVWLQLERANQGDAKGLESTGK